MDTIDNVKATLERLQADPRADDATLLAYFDGLPAAKESDMIGEWRGGILSREHPAEMQLGALRWDGKRFVDRDQVYPIISRDNDGNRVVNDALGTASLREVVFRGVCTATMVYDTHPVFDHFRRVDDDRVVGVMDRKGAERPLVFWLARIGPAQ